MPVNRLSISVSSDVEETIRTAAARADLPVSTWLSRAATRAAILEDGRRAIQEHEAEHGRLDDVHRAEARKILDSLGVVSPDLAPVDR